VVAEKDFSDSTIMESADRASVPQPGTLKIERLA
jgi:hypothetical protein